MSLSEAFRAKENNASLSRKTIDKLGEKITRFIRNFVAARNDASASVQAQGARVQKVAELAEEKVKGSSVSPAVHRYLMDEISEVKNNASVIVKSLMSREAGKQMSKDLLSAAQPLLVSERLDPSSKAKVSRLVKTEVNLLNSGVRANDRKIDSLVNKSHDFGGEEPSTTQQIAAVLEGAERRLNKLLEKSGVVEKDSGRN
ncbi:hypothetical protein [Burkholderia ubonensis]|uniref:hypothetical protein n=1 Tax=Burkholderia ubonensis TaxID=101571 RepID=UPI0012FBDF04|nr:hypothetical protein [Burkholderia ubonensis]